MNINMQVGLPPRQHASLDMAPVETCGRCAAKSCRKRCHDAAKHPRVVRRQAFLGGTPNRQTSSFFVKCSKILASFEDVRGTGPSFSSSGAHFGVFSPVLTERVPRLVGQAFYTNFRDGGRHYLMEKKCGPQRGAHRPEREKSDSALYIRDTFAAQGRQGESIL